MHERAPVEYDFDGFTVRTDERVVRVAGASVALPAKVVDTLLVLLDARGRFVSKAELMERVWPDAFVDEANLTQNVYVLRKAFAERGGRVRIENVPKRGYRLVAPAAAVTPAAAAPPAGEASPRRSAPSPASRYAPRFALAALGALLVLGLGGPASVSRPAAIRGTIDPYRLPAAPLERYLLGRYYLNRGTERDLRRGVASFEAVVAASPQSPLGFAGLADALTSLSFRAPDAETRARLEARAIALAGEAVARGGDSADAYAALGAVRESLEHDDESATRAFATALRLDPRNLDALVWYGTELMNAGRVARARQLFARAAAVDPTAPGPIASLAWVDFLDRDYADAAAFATQLLRAHRLESLARLTLATAYVEMQDYARARPAAEALRHEPGMGTQGAALLAQLDALRGAPERARRRLARLEAATDPERIGPWDILALAAAYARAGREDAAFVWLARIRSSERRQLARDPRFDLLRKDPRFEGWLSG